MAVGARIIVYHGAVGSAAAPIADGEVFLDLTAGWYVGQAGVWVAAPGGGGTPGTTAPGVPGPAGEDGAGSDVPFVVPPPPPVLSGQGPPTNFVAGSGAAGQVYFDVSNPSEPLMYFGS
jgi:hypothetical protein